MSVRALCVLLAGGLRCVRVCARVNGDIAIVQVSNCHECPGVPCVSVSVPLTVSYPSQFYAVHAHGCETADTLGLAGIRDGVPCLLLNLGNHWFLASS